MPENKPSGPQGENPPLGFEPGGPFFVLAIVPDWNPLANPPKPLETVCHETSNGEHAKLIAEALNVTQAGGPMFPGFAVRPGSTMAPSERLLASRQAAQLASLAEKPPTERDVDRLGLEHALLVGIHQQCRELEQEAAALESPGDMNEGDSEEEHRDDLPALTASVQLVLVTMARFDGSRLLKVEAIREAMDESNALGERTIGVCVKKLIDLKLAERPDGKRGGARLTRKGRKLEAEVF